MGEEEKMVWNINGGQVNLASGNSIINATQNNGFNSEELNTILSGIMRELTGLNTEDAEKITDIVDMVRGEFDKPEPKISRLRNSLTLIAPIMTVVNGMPILADNIHKLADFISLYIH